ncbi:MAG: hypothetical protein L6R40_000272 [Gallowayella cf. fulva]|nr:MAG: hypothetical protein L6R40_000272 [Xanthomendoza cf. fulva]
MSSGCPRQQFSFESVLTCIGDPMHIDIRVAFDGLDEFEKEWQLKEFCTELVHAVKHPSEHLLRLDAHLSQLLPGALKQRPGWITPEQIVCSKVLASEANQLLSRFPKAPQRLFTLPLSNSGLFAKRSTVWDRIKDGRWASRYLVPEARSLFQTPYGDDAASVMQLLEDMQDHAWDNFFVTSFIDTNNMIFMLKIADLGHQPDLNFALSFRAYVNILGELVDQYDALVDAVKFGVREPFEDPTPSVQALKAALFPAVSDDHEQCLSVLKVYLWSAWQRSVMLYFYYLIGVRLWQCENPRAVIANEYDESLHYCKASSSTMAISHVWSHGQGGRPEDGINICLHKRYCQLANAFDCDSYWIDSTCIPDDLQLRKEAIMSINQIFCDSKITLISDKDMQSKSMRSASVADFETLLSILLVCDWGVRAWTMLEAIRGNRSIHILCADDHTIGLVELLRTVHQKGKVDLVILLGSAQHLLPAGDSNSAKPIEEVGHLLSQRHASRTNDEIIIWGLVSNMKAPADVLQLWKAREQVATAFLMSSAQRIDGFPGYGWAPATPYIRPQRRNVQLPRGQIQIYSVRYPSYDGSGSYSARITAQGLQGLWLVHDMDQAVVSDLYAECVERMSPTQWTDRELEKPLVGCEDGLDSMVFERPDYAKACDTLRSLLSTPYTKARVIRPLDSEGTSLYLGNDERGEDFAVLVAICVCYGTSRNSKDCNDLNMVDCEKWEWKGVFEWIDDSHPDWTTREMLIV